MKRRTCERCKGTGIIEVRAGFHSSRRQENKRRSFRGNTERCPDCLGKGYIGGESFWGSSKNIAMGS